MYAIPEKLRDFRKAKGLTQEQMANKLSMEQTTYGKVELGKNSLRLETAYKIGEIIDKELSVFATLPQIYKNVNDTSIVDKRENINKEGTAANNYNSLLPEKIIRQLEELLGLFKAYVKSQ
jgi:transcriptional regulator with XRE-family HTH domain